MSNTIFILRAGDTSNPTNLPAGWPVTASFSPQDAPWVLVDELDAYKATLQPDYDAWKAMQPTQSPEAWNAALAGGYTDPSGIRLKTDLEAQAWFAKLRGQLADGVALGLVTNDTPWPVPVYDADAVPHLMTVIQIRQLLWGYGVYVGTVYDKFKP